MNARRVTQKDVARELGLSVQAVSMALRDLKDVSAETRQRVREKAEELGYRPDPGLRALADYRTGQQQAAVRWNRVALVHNWPSQQAWRNDVFYQRWFEELKRAAKTRGIEIEEHWLGACSERAPAVIRSLRNRGISGVFIAPPGIALDVPRVNLPREHFEIVTFGPEHLYPDYHTVQFDFYENLRLAWSTLSARGFRRIGLVYQKFQGWRTGHAWRAAYHIEKLLAGGVPGVFMPLELAGETGKANERTYLSWLKQDRYDAVISSIYALSDWNRGLQSAPEVAYFNVREPHQQGIDLNLPSMAETAIELLYMEMQRSLANRKRLPFRVHIPGKWSDRRACGEAREAANG